MKPPMMRASKVVGVKVVNAADEPLGKVDDFVIDYLQGRVAYVILHTGKKLLPIPMPAFSYRPTENILVLHVDKQTLKLAPSYPAKGLDWLNDRGNGELIHSHYGYSPYWE